MQKAIKSLRELKIVLGSVWRNLAFFAALLLAASLLLKITQCYGDSTWGEVFIKAIVMSELLRPYRT